MNFNSYYLWPKKFVEDTVKAEEMADKPFVDEYTEEILNKELYDLEEEDLKTLINQLSYAASFYARLRRTVMNHTGRIMLERMMDEADFEAEFEQELKEILEEE
jgi:hypothetical protein|tara:strand:+ start:5871 stop:6182 length:312 start_codon:yes stop_codon:yes gene_type:complete